jgi:hypothetical protein
MRLPLPLKRRPVLWLIIPALPLIYLVSAASAPPTWQTGYWTWTVAHPILLILVSAGVSEVGAALEGARLRRGTRTNVLNLRAPAAVIFDAIWPSFVCGLLLQFAAIALTAVYAPGGSSALPFALLAAIGAMLLFHTAAGFLIGTLAPPVVSIPLSLVFSYCWLGFTGTVGWMPLRHLAGLVLESCCSVDEQPAPASLAAVTLFSVIAALGMLVAAAARLRLSAAEGRQSAVYAIATVVVALAATVGLLVAAGLGPTSAEQRAAAALICFHGRPVVCLYPEQLAGPPVVSEVKQMLGNVTETGVALPQRVVAGRGEASRTRIDLRYVLGMSRSQIADSLASSFQGDESLVCKGEPSRRLVHRQEVGEIVRGWLTATMLGQHSTKGLSDLVGDVPNGLGALLRLPAAQQATWITQGMASMTRCDVDPHPGIPS